MSYNVTIKNIQQVTHDVNKYTFEKPDGYEFVPGQATEVSIDKDGWREKKRPFTFTSLNEEPDLEFVIKIYPDHEGVTEQIGKLAPGDCFIIDDPWGTIQYRGPGVFLAGGAGVTPFIAIIRNLYRKNELEGNKLIFSNKSEKDIILRDEFNRLLGENFINVIIDEPTEKYIDLDGYIDRKFLESRIKDFHQPFYICGPMDFNKAMISYLKELGADPEALVFEK